MIVDDEVIFRANLKTMLNWNAYGYELCGEASNGLSAKEQLEQLHPDLVITDIRMPGVDGLSLISFMNEHYPDIPIIALSGYDDFEYARSCIKYGVMDYLLKHSVTKESLLAVLETARKKITHGKEQQQTHLRMQEQLAYGQQAIRQKFLLDLIEGRIKKEAEIAKKIEQLELSLDTRDLVVVVAEIDGMSRWKEKYSSQEWTVRFEEMMEMVEKVMSSLGKSVVVHQPESRFTILFSMQNMHSVMRVYNHVGNCIQQVRTVLKRYCNVTACYSMSGKLQSIEQVPQAYAKAAQVLTNKLYRDFDMVLRDQAVPKTISAPYTFNMQDEQALLQLLKAADREGVLNYLHQIFENIRESHLDAARVQIIFAELFNLLNRFLRDYQMDITAVYPDFQQVMFQHFQHMTLNEMNEWLANGYCKALQLTVQPAENQDCHEVTRQACSFIKRNFTDNISLNDIAEQIGVSSSYLSRIFKEDTGKGVVEYLNHVRVEYAKQLIAEGAKLNELSKRVGFNSNTYFFTVFKQSTGKTPKQYKQNGETTDQPKSAG